MSGIDKTAAVTAEISNCNNISSGKVFWEKGKLNIKYGLNGTGKTTIGKAVIASSKIKSELHHVEYTLESLRPYGTEDDESKKPSVIISEDVGKVAVFNEDYVSSFLFTDAGLMSDAFSIFVKPEGYEDRIEEINGLMKALPGTFSEIPELDTLLESLGKLIGEYGRAQNGIGKSAGFYKALYEGNKLDNIPEDLSGYSGYLKPNDKLAPWLKWQSDGLGYLSDDNDHCPFCTGPIKANRESISRLSTEYNVSGIKPLVEILEVCESLSVFFNDETKERLDKIIHNKEKFNSNDNDFLMGIKFQAEKLQKRLGSVKYFSYRSLDNPSEIGNMLRNLFIEIENYSCFDSAKTRVVTDAVNRNIEEVQKLVADLEEKTRELKNQIDGRIIANKSFIDKFMERSGYRYKIDIVDLDDHEKCRALLRTSDNQISVDDADKHLSYGEKNAFALALFLVDVVYQKPDLIIIDDPVSSFDGNKKYALFSMLFSDRDSSEKAYSLIGKTVLLFTHEEEIVRDVIRVFDKEYKGIASAAFLQVDKNGNLAERRIKKDDIRSFRYFADKAVRNSSIPDIIKVIYLRRYFDIEGNSDGPAYNLLSQLLHKRQIPQMRDKSTGVFRDFTDAERVEAETAIREMMPSFSYDNIFKSLTEENLVKAYNGSMSNYEKLQLFRVLVGDSSDIRDKDPIHSYFIDSTFHIENESIYQLDPRKFPTVPQYIIDICDKYIAEEYSNAPKQKMLLEN